MKHVVYRWIIDFEKEEKWLNEMASKGLNFIGFSFPGRYLFDEGTPGEYIYRLELLDNLPKHPKSQEYIRFVEETGAELVSFYLRWIWFRKKAYEGSFEIYSDYSSKIKHYKKVASLIGFLGLLNIVIGFYNLFYGLLLSGPKFHFYFNSILSPINLFVGTISTIVFLKYAKAVKKLKREKQIRE